MSRRDEQGDAHRAPSPRTASGRGCRWARRRWSGPVPERRIGRRPPNADRVRSRRSSAAWAASLSRSKIDRNEPVPVPRRRRREPAGEPQVPEQDHERDDEGPDPERDRRRRSRPEDGVEADARVPQRVGPEVDPDAEQQEDGDDDDQQRGEPEPPTGSRGPAPAAVIGAARRTRHRRIGRAAAPASLVDRLRTFRPRRRRPGPRGPRGRRHRGRGRRCRGRRRLVVVAPSWSSSSGPRIGSSGLARRPALAARGGLALAELLHEVIEQVAHRGSESTCPVRSGSVEPLDGAAEPGQHGLGEFVRAHRRGPGGLEPERRPDRQRHAPRSGRRRPGARPGRAASGADRRPRG